MTCNYKLYDLEWKSRIRPDILKRAGNKCEQCGLDNGILGWRTKEGEFLFFEVVNDALDLHGYDYFENELKHHISSDGSTMRGPFKIVLTISHTDHDITNNDYLNLRALCQKCHLSHDKGHHKETRRRNKGLQSLF